MSRLTAMAPPGGRGRTSNPGWPRGPPPVGASRRDLPTGCARRSPERSPGDGGSIPPTSTELVFSEPCRWRSQTISVAPTSRIRRERWWCYSCRRMSVASAAVATWRAPYGGQRDRSLSRRSQRSRTQDDRRPGVQEGVQRDRTGSRVPPNPYRSRCGRAALLRYTHPTASGRPGVELMGG